MTTISKNENGVQISGAPLTTTISSANSPLLTNEIDNRIVKVRPMSTPIDQLSRCGDIRHAGSMKVFYYTSDIKDTSTTLTRAIQRGDYTEGDYGAAATLTLSVKNASIFSVTETVMVPGAVDEEASAPLTLYITEVGNGTITGKVIAGMPTFNAQVTTSTSDKSIVVRMGRAAGELDVQTPQYETLPLRGENYCQIFKMQVEESTLHRLSNKEARWSFSDQEEAAIIDMRQGMEKNFIFGSKAKIQAGNGGDDIYLTGGIWNQVPAKNRLQLPMADLAEGDLVSLCRSVFTGNKGSGRKILMAGSGFIEELSNIKTDRIVVGGASMVRWGLEFREIKSNFGTLYVIHNEIFDQCGHSLDAMILDPSLLTKYVHIPFTTEKLDLRTSGTRNTEAVVITEASCLVLRNPGCHFRVSMV